jgi:hypothetical protein
MQQASVRAAQCAGWRRVSRGESSVPDREGRGAAAAADAGGGHRGREGSFARSPRFYLPCSVSRALGWAGVTRQWSGAGVAGESDVGRDPRSGAGAQARCFRGNGWMIYGGAPGACWGAHRARGRAAWVGVACLSAAAAAAPPPALPCRVCIGDKTRVKKAWPFLPHVPCSQSVSAACPVLSSETIPLNSRTDAAAMAWKCDCDCGRARMPSIDRVRQIGRWPGNNAPGLKVCASSSCTVIY